MTKLLGPARSADAWRNSPGRAFLGANAHLLPRITQRCNWLLGDDTLSRLPFHIASKLADRTYQNFDQLRTQFWKLVADDAFVQGIYTTDERRHRGVKEGLAPLAPETQQIVKVTRTVNPGVIKGELPRTADGSPGGVIYESAANPDDLKSYALHHMQPIHAGGGVYDLGNLVVVTPLAHDALLSRDYHYQQPEWLVKKIEAFYANKK